MKDIANQRIWRKDVPWRDEGVVIITKQRGGRISRGLLRMLGMKTTMEVRLDAVGSAVWRALDGRTAQEILGELEDAFPNESQLNERMGRYLGALVGHGLVTVEGL